MTVKRQALKNVFQASWMFGHPVPRSTGVSQAYWSKPTSDPYAYKGGGWMPCLYGGVQGGSNWAALYIPVNEMPLRVFEKAQWSYYMKTEQTMGVNIVIWIHDPDDFDKRAEVTQLGNVSGLEKASGWNAHEFNTATAQMFHYGEGTTGTTSSADATDLDSWDTFQADPLFKNWTIYRISLEHGWEASGTFDQVWIGEVKLNEVPIPLIPAATDQETAIYQYHTATNDSIATVLSPKTPFRLLSVMLHLSAAATGNDFTIKCDAGRVASVYDTLLYLKAMSGVTDIVVPFGVGYEFTETDEIDAAWTKSGTVNYGLTYAYQTVF